MSLWNRKNINEFSGVVHIKSDIYGWLNFSKWEVNYLKNEDGINLIFEFQDLSLFCLAIST